MLNEVLSTGLVVNLTLYLCCCDEYHNQLQLRGGMDLPDLNFHSTVYHWWKSGGRTQGRNQHRGHEGILLAGLFFIACQGWHCSPWDLGPPKFIINHQSWLTDVPTGWSGGCNSTLTFPLSRWLYFVSPWQKLVSIVIIHTCKRKDSEPQLCNGPSITVGFVFMESINHE